MNATQKEMQAWLKEKLAVSDSWSRRALELMYQRQTELEKRTGTTIDGNDEGFNSVDAPVLTKLRERLVRYGTLDNVDSCVLRTKICRYSLQVLRLSNKQKILDMMICDKADQIRLANKVKAEYETAIQKQKLAKELADTPVPEIAPAPVEFSQPGLF